ncbi:cysteine desulfurase [Planctomycetes bacterium CA13]
MDTEQIRHEFPILDRQIGGEPLVYLDSAATYLKPRAVIDAVCDCYRQTAGTIGRGVHVLAEDAVSRFDDARETIADFINADADEIVFVRNATEAINLVASSLPAGTSVLGSAGEHHSNLLPWRRGLRFHGIPLADDGHVNLESVEPLLQAVNPKLLTTSTISNAFGNLHPVDPLTRIAHAAGCDVLLDANQSVAHHRMDVRALDCEYLCFSGHKLGGPTGIGVLYAKRDRLELLQPRLFGGGMVESVDSDGYELADLPMRLESGTASFEGVIGLSAACEFFEAIGLESLAEHERQLTRQLHEGLTSIPRVTVRGPKLGTERGAIVSFHIQGLEAHGAARMLSNRANICVRSGFHCAQLAHESRGWRPTVRASFGVYNTSDEVDVLLNALRQITLNLG